MTIHTVKPHAANNETSKIQKSPYNPEFVAQVKENLKLAKMGEVITIKDPKNIWPSIIL